MTLNHLITVRVGVGGLIKRIMIIAIYKLNGKLLKTTNLEKKLKKLKRQSPEILFKEEYKGDLKEAENYLDYIIKKNYVIDEEDDTSNEVKLHHYINKKTGYTHTSIYDNEILEGYEQID